MNRIFGCILLVCSLGFRAHHAPAEQHIVFMIGEREYETKTTLPAFARSELRARGFRFTIIQADTTDGNHFPGLESALQEADLLVMSVRRRTLPTAQLNAVRTYLEQGKPLVALRTSSHAFALREGYPPAGHAVWPHFDEEVLGARYEDHYNNTSGTRISVNPERRSHPILTGVDVDAFHSGGTLYRSRALDPAAEVLLNGETTDNGTPVTEPVAWTHQRGTQRVFYTSLGHPDDFEVSAFRRILLNAVYWSLDMTPPPAEHTTGDTDVERYLSAFEGRGDLTDGSALTPAQEALAAFSMPTDIVADLIAAEPIINQPVELNFDHRGRLWVVQYNQYPYPAGLKIVDTDWHLRATFDRIPDPPPAGTPGADTITILEDTDGDGTFDQATNAISGLNIATSVTLGRGRIWVLNPPYLLAYPDPDGDGIPDGAPEVHLEGFGLEDTHAVANSLRWGPDGWLYGAQGSTCHATVSSAVTKNVHFKGQAVWRYHPESQVFEIYAEGGGNTFHVEIDAQGRVYSGHNGGEARGQYYKQGAYYVKNWGKHGSLTNPYAFGYFDHMQHTGENLRFTHAGVVYEGAALPDRYNGKLISINPLHNFVTTSRLLPDGSSLRTEDEDHLLDTDDTWFRPVDIKVGPDGGVYLADWSDSRLTHVDPRDTWHRASGRLYRLRGPDASPPAPFDLSTQTSDELVDMLTHENKWFRFQALRLLGDRRDQDITPRLRGIIETESGQPALDALWALHLSGGFDDAVAERTIEHTNPFVRMWTVRLLGDRRDITHRMGRLLVEQATVESHPEVRSQLAASAKRLPGPLALPLIRALLERDADATDPHIPLQLWWAVEDKAESDRTALLALFEDAALWKHTLVRETILTRLMQRYVMAGGPDNFAAAQRLLEYAPDGDARTRLLTGLQEGMRGRSPSEFPPALMAALDAYMDQSDLGALTLGIRRGLTDAVDEALRRIQDPALNRTERIRLIQVFAEVDQPRVVPILLDLINPQTSPALATTAMHTLQRYDAESIATVVLSRYPDQLRHVPALRSTALELLTSRQVWTRQLVTALETRRIHPTDIPVHLVQRMSGYENPELDATLQRFWPHIRPHTPDVIEQQMVDMRQVLQAGAGRVEFGKQVYDTYCGTCHRLNGEGGRIGPDLTGYERGNTEAMLRNIVDPNAAIREGYVQYIVQTTDNRLLTGLLVGEQGDQITFRSVGGQETTLLRANIREMKPMQQSMMPERLLDALSDEQIRDLFAYLARG